MIMKASRINIPGTQYHIAFALHDVLMTRPFPQSGPMMSIISYTCQFSIFSAPLVPWITKTHYHGKYRDELTKLKRALN